MPRLKRKLGIGSAIAIGCLSALGIGVGARLLWEKAFHDKPVPAISEEEPKPIASEEKPKPIVYSDFFKIDFDSLPTEKIEIPSNLERLEEELLYGEGYGDKPKVSNPKSLEKLILAEALSLGYNTEKINTLSAKDAIMLGVDIVTSRIEYHPVDTDDDFIAKHGEHLPIDTYFELGLGDCDKYSGSLMAALETIKKHNPNLKNMYFTRDLGGLVMAHSWNSITILTKDKVILTHIDPTWYDNGSDLEAKRGRHIPEDDKELFARFYADISNFRKSYEIYSEISNETEDTDRKAGILSDMAYLAYQLRDKSKMDKIRERYLRLCVQDDLDNILYYSWGVEKEAGNHDRAEQFKQELIDKFPKSSWVKYL